MFYLKVVSDRAGGRLVAVLQHCVLNGTAYSGLVFGYFGDGGSYNVFDFV